MKKLFFDAKATKMIREASGLSNRFQVDLRYVEEYNRCCPGCDIPFKETNGILSGVGVVASFIPMGDKKPLGISVPACLCKSCERLPSHKKAAVREKIMNSITEKLNLDVMEIDKP